MEHKERDRIRYFIVSDSKALQFDACEQMGGRVALVHIAKFQPHPAAQVVPFLIVNLFTVCVLFVRL